MSRYWKGSQTKHRLMYHLVWIPKYRKRVLKGRVAERLAELLYECADLQRWKIEELNIQEDHVHILVRLRPEISVSRMVQLFKGMTSRVIREEFPELKEFCGEKTSRQMDILQRHRVRLMKSRLENILEINRHGQNRGSGGF